MPASTLQSVHALVGGATARTRPDCPPHGSPHTARTLGDSGGMSCMCPACGHSWS